jgi:predicted nucleic acid-binding Zn ribbon protein
MPIYALRCDQGHEFEAVCPVNDRNLQTCDCGAKCRVVPAIGQVNCANEDAGWIRSIREVVAKDSKDPHDRAMLKAGATRSDYKRWLKSNGLRHLEPGEKTMREVIDPIRHADKIMELRRERNRITIR